MIKFLVGIFLVALPCITHGQSWKDDYVQAQQLYENEKNDEALKLAQQSLTKYQEGGGETGPPYFGFCPRFHLPKKTLKAASASRKKKF